MIDRMTAIKDACTLISVPRSQHGEVYFYLSPGRCGGTAPIYPAPVEMPPGADDMQIDAVDGAAFWLGREQRGYLAKLHLTMDLAPGNNCNFCAMTAVGNGSCSACGGGPRRKGRPWPSRQTDSTVAGNAVSVA